MKKTLLRSKCLQHLATVPDPLEEQLTMRKRATVLSGGASRMKMKYGRESLSRPPVSGSIIKASDQSTYGWILFFLCELCKSRNAGGDSVDILGLAQFRAQVMFGVLRHV